MIIDSFSEIYLEKDLDYLPMTISFFVHVKKIHKQVPTMVVPKIKTLAMLGQLHVCCL